MKPQRRGALLPGGSCGIQALVTALLELVSARRELSHDRAGLLDRAGIEASVRHAIEMAGGAHLHEIGTALASSTSPQ